jgi:putative oxidoreductase
MSASTRNIIAWILQVLLAVAFIASGGNKLVHLADTVKGFGGMGFPSWFVYFIAGAEVLGGIGLLIPRFTRLAALGLMLIMVGAAYVHATKIPGGLLPNGFPALGLLALLVVVYLLRRPVTARA